MDFKADSPNNTLLIRHYSEGKLVMPEATYTDTLMIFDNRITLFKEAATIDALSADMVNQLLAKVPALVLIGTGAKQIFPPHSLLAPLYQKRIGIEIMNTAAACRTYNVLIAEGRKVLALLFL